MPSAYWRNSSICPCGPRSTPGLCASILAPCNMPESFGQLAEAGGEVVVPEQRHLLLQRTPRVDHPEHPALTRIVDVDVRREEVCFEASTCA